MAMSIWEQEGLEECATSSGAALRRNHRRPRVAGVFLLCQQKLVKEPGGRPLKTKAESLGRCLELFDLDVSDADGSGVVLGDEVSGG